MIVQDDDVLMAKSKYKSMILEFKKRGCRCGSLPPDEHGTCETCRYAARKLAEIKRCTLHVPEGRY